MKPFLLKKEEENFPLFEFRKNREEEGLVDQPAL